MERTDNQRQDDDAASEPNLADMSRQLAADLRQAGFDVWGPGEGPSTSSEEDQPDDVEPL